MLGFPLLYIKGMRLMMFQLSGFYYKGTLKQVWSRRPPTRRVRESFATSAATLRVHSEFPAPRRTVRGSLFKASITKGSIRIL